MDLMDENLQDDKVLRSYLLGELQEEEADRLERRMIEDDEFFELCEAVEADLLAAYARGEAAAAEALQRLAFSPGGRARLALARSLNSAADSGHSESRTVVPFRRGGSVPRPGVQWAALAAAILVLVGVFWFTRQAPPENGAPARLVSKASVPESRPRSIATKKLASSVAKTPAAEVAPVPPDRLAGRDERARAKLPERRELLKFVIELTLMTLRGAERAEIQKFSVPAGTELVEIQLYMDDMEGFEDLGLFHAAVRNEERETVWEKGGLKPRRRGSTLVLDIPDGRLPSGRYEVTVTAGTDYEVTQQFEVARENP